MSTEKKLTSLKNEELDTKGIKGGASIRKHDVLSTPVDKESGSVGKTKGGKLIQNIGVDDGMSSGGDENYYPPKH